MAITFKSMTSITKIQAPSPPNTFRITCSPEFKVHGYSFNTRVSLGGAFCGASLINKDSDSRVSNWPATCQRCSVHLSHVLFLPCITAAWRHSLKRDPLQHLTRRERREGEGVKSLWKKQTNMHTPLLPFITQSWQLPRLSGWMAASMNVYYRKSVALVLKLSQEASKQLALSVITGNDPT